MLGAYDITKPQISPSCFYLKKNQACDSVHLSAGTQEMSLQVQGRPPLHTEFQASLQNKILLKQNQTKPLLCLGHAGLLR